MILTPDQKQALPRAHDTAMFWALKARIPECGVFGNIAQDLAWLINLVEDKDTDERLD